jgi:hypothetical protein
MIKQKSLTDEVPRSVIGDDCGIETQKMDFQFKRFFPLF